VVPATGFSLSIWKQKRHNGVQGTKGGPFLFVKILLIEDNPGDVLLIQQILSTALSSVKIRVAMDGEQALQMLANPEFIPDLIILDLNIPKVPGIAILAQCKPPAPVVVFSSSSNPTEIQRAKELGVREFVQKPIDFEEFEKVVKRMIRDWANPEANCAKA
jgi:DNA-binding NarL/FixJ family response regulator